jgi:hypothetical protein
LNFLQQVLDDADLRKKVVELYMAGDLAAIEELSRQRGCATTVAAMVRQFQEHRGELSNSELELISAGRSKTSDHYGW